MAFYIPKEAYTKLFRPVQIKGSIQKIKKKKKTIVGNENASLKWN